MLARQIACGWIVLVALVLVSGFGDSQTLAAEPAVDKPNILFIFLDDFGWKDASYMGSDFYETPHLDRLASSGLVFTNAYSCAATVRPPAQVFSRDNTLRDIRSTTSERSPAGNRSIEGLNIFPA